LRVIHRGYLKGCPNLTAKGVSKYLDPSPATAKGHMKWPLTGIHSTPNCQANANPESAPPNLKTFDNDFKPRIDVIPWWPPSNANIIKANKESPANIFCFAAFADKHTGVLYSDLTGTFLFMSIKENVCFLIIYHYKTNAILALPITNFSNKSILAVYTLQSELLESRGHNIKLNVMDMQVSCIIKQFLILKKMWKSFCWAK
jgi:hypothetical protein